MVFSESGVILEKEKPPEGGFSKAGIHD